MDEYFPNSGIVVSRHEFLGMVLLWAWKKDNGRQKPHRIPKNSNRDCSYCRGTGQKYLDYYKKYISCPDCRGTGDKRNEPAPIPAGD